MQTLVHPVGRLVLVEVFAEATRSGLVVIEDEHRSLQGQVIELGPLIPQEDDDQADLRVGDEVLFDDNGCQWWRGPLPSYLSAVLDDPAQPEYVLVPYEQILGVLAREEGTNDGQTSQGRRTDRSHRPEQARPEAAAVP